MANSPKTHPEYIVWCALRQRCRNPNHPFFERYGGRGITVDPRWESFSNFFEDMGPRPSSKHSIDRIDNDGPYAPWNCRWATSIEQGRNTSKTRPITCRGETHSVNEWSRRSGRPARTILRRVFQYGWDPEKAIFDNDDPHTHYLEHDGLRMSLAKWGQRLGIKEKTIAMRLRRGFSPEEALYVGRFKTGPK
jgi:hypothetical protein